MFDDLRGFINKANELGDCRVIEGADWDLEIGAITEIEFSTPNTPMLLFDRIKGYKPGYRVATNLYTTMKRTALALGLPLEAKGVALVQAWRDKLQREMKPLPPVKAKTAPVKENVITGDKVDLFKLPAPRWHEHDGGRYLGTGDVVITRDPDSGWINLGTHRMQIHDKNIATVFMMGQVQHADQIRRKYWARGQACPVAVCVGQEPMVFAAASIKIPWGVSEYEYAGWLKDKPIEVIEGETTGLPIPATAEIVLEGEIVPPEAETRIEGPFGEWTGYYASGSRAEPVFRVKSILHRNNPIIQGNPPLIGAYALGLPIRRPAAIWDALDKQIPGIKGVWGYEEVAGPGMTVISLKQMYEGHAKQAALLAAGSDATAYQCKFIIVVDDDIDPSNLPEVIWAMATRCDPAIAIDIARGCRGSPLDPVLPPEKRTRNEITTNKAMILACRPYHWMKDFPETIKSSPELLNKIRAKWGKSLTS